MANRFGFPNLGFGMGLRTTHFSHILEHHPSMDWFEIISENFMDTDGRPVRILKQICEHYPVVMHGVSMSIGSTDPLDDNYMKKLKALADWVKPPWISDHLCWTGINKRNTHDLLPVPYTEDALKHIVSRIKQVQDILERPLVLENPSTYLEFADSQMSEWEFIARMAEEADCGLLLDANNVYVSCYNHNWDEKTYIDAIPADRVVQIHLAGHENKGTHIIDTHEGHVIDEVWKLYRYIISRTGPVSTMVEWDEAIPEFDVVAEEVGKAKAFVKNLQVPNDLPSHGKETVNREAKSPAPYLSMVEPMQDAILEGDSEPYAPEEWIPAKDNFSSKDQLQVYINGYRYRLFDLVYDDLPVLLHYLGQDMISRVIFDYVEDNPSEHFNLAYYIGRFPDYIKTLDYLKKDRFAHELALLEVTMTLVFDWEETPSLKQDEIATIDPEAFMDMHLLPRKALKLLAFDHNVNEYYHAVKNEEEVEPKEEKSFLAVYRDEDVMYRLALQEEEYNLLNLLFNEMSIGEAIERLIGDKDIDEEELAVKFQEWFGSWIRNNIISQAA